MGAGAVGSSVAGWIAPKYDNLFLLARGESANAIKSQGLKFYLKNEESSAVSVPIKVIESLDEISYPGIIVITVKNYDLDATSRTLQRQLGTIQPVIVGLQNGVDNQQILPRYFTKVIYGVVCYNAWRDRAGEVGHQERGYIILGTPANDLRPEQQEIQRIFRLGLDCTLTDRLEDAAHCKLAINLQNALIALVGFGKRPIESPNILVKMTMRLIWEGIRVIQAAGFKEHELGSNPSWNFIKMGAKLPASITSIVYQRNVKKFGPNSMTQDIWAGKTMTELESLNGYMLTLAQKVGVPMPINQTVYEIAKERFGQNFQPITEAELWTAIQKNLRKQ